MTRYCFPDTRIGQPVAAGTKCIWQCPGQSSYHQVCVIFPIIVLQSPILQTSKRIPLELVVTGHSPPVTLSPLRPQGITSPADIVDHQSSSDQLCPQCDAGVWSDPPGTTRCMCHNIGLQHEGEVRKKKTQFLVILRCRWCATHL